MTTQPNDYASYMMRLWKTQEGAGAAWRISLEDTRSGCRWQFSSLEAMVTFLQGETGSEQGADTPQAETHGPTTSQLDWELASGHAEEWYRL